VPKSSSYGDACVAQLRKRFADIAGPVAEKDGFGDFELEDVAQQTRRLEAVQDMLREVSPREFRGGHVDGDGSESDALLRPFHHVRQHHLAHPVADRHGQDRVAESFPDRIRRLYADDRIAPAKQGFEADDLTRDQRYLGLVIGHDRIVLEGIAGAVKDVDAGLEAVPQFGIVEDGSVTAFALRGVQSQIRTSEDLGRRAGMMGIRSSPERWGRRASSTRCLISAASMLECVRISCARASAISRPEIASRPSSNDLAVRKVCVAIACTMASVFFIRCASSCINSSRRSSPSRCLVLSRRIFT
jgi:hypothetical protein